MADGAASRAAERAAGRAAADAAAEAKAEALAAGAPAAGAVAAAPTGRGRRRIVTTAWAAFILEVWVTDFHGVKFGFYKHKRNQAKSRQFTADMDIFAEIIENGERTGLLGYREDLWRKHAGMDKRLVLKLFNETLNWHASMDLMLGRSLQLTLGARGLPVTAFSLNAGQHDDMVYLERSANKWPLAPEHFSFFLLNDGAPQFYRLRRDVIDLSGDYTLFNHRNETVGRIEGRLLSLGGQWHVRVRPDHATPLLMAVLKLYCGMLPFNGGCRRHVRRVFGDVRAGRYQPRIEKQEADLYINPRRVR